MHHTDWSRWPKIIRLYHNIDSVLRGRTTEVQYSYTSLLYAAAAYRVLAAAPLSKVQYHQLQRAWSDRRVIRLDPRQRHLLLFVTGCALARWETLEAKQLLSEALALSGHVWLPSHWQPWMGPRPEQRRRVNIEHLLPGAPDPVDPTGDPEEVTGAVEVEGDRSHLDAFASVGEILDGINAWEAVMRDCLNLELGLFRQGARAAIYRLLPIPHVEEEIVEAVALWAQARAA